MWIILAVLAGIFSSFIIQLLSYSAPQNRDNSSAKKPSYNPPSSPQPSFKNTPKNKVFSQPLPVENNTQYKSQPEEIDPDFDFDFEEDFIPETSLIYQKDNINIKQKKEQINLNFEDNVPVENISQDEVIITEKNQEVLENINFSISETLEEESSKIEEKEEDMIYSPVEDIPSETFLKIREASLYSYQPGEKTEITPKRLNPTPPKTRSSNSPKSLDNKERKQVYDAPYRVISPASDNILPKDDEEFFDDDEDWDF
ncbi:hypothetical protein GM3709_3038 [Geminocystis sp. NIES-3709]|nr:hypothetical protein GM3709_3038 [Geminocystis sp. NIES-3709]